MPPEFRASFYDKDWKMRTVYGAGLKRIAGCLRFVEVGPGGAVKKRRQFPESKVTIEALTGGKNPSQ